jgi:hypothetical protein
MSGGKAGRVSEKFREKGWGVRIRHKALMMGTAAHKGKLGRSFRLDGLDTEALLGPDIMNATETIGENAMSTLPSV